MTDKRDIYNANDICFKQKKNQIKKGQMRNEKERYFYIAMTLTIAVWANSNISVFTKSKKQKKNWK